MTILDSLTNQDIQTMNPVTTQHIYQLLLDFDDKNFKKITKTILNRYASLFNIIDLRFLGCKVFETKHGFHVCLDVKTEQLNGNKHYNTAFLQLLLCSDYKREAFNLRRVSNGATENWNVLFQAKFQNGECVGKETFSQTKTNKLKTILLSIINTKQ